jgi:adenylate cyclase
LNESTSFNLEYRQRQQSRLTRNLRVSVPVGALVSLFFIPWNQGRDQSGDLPTTEVGIALAGGLMLLLGLTWLPRSRQYLDAITLAGCLWALVLVSVMLALLPDGFLLGVGSLLALIIVMTVLAVDLSRPVALICAGSFIVVPNLALVFSNASTLEIVNTNWILLPGVVIAVSLAFIMDRGHRQTFSLERQLAEEKARGDALLDTLLPHRIALRLQESDDVIADIQPMATVLFADLVGFTRLTRTMSPDELIDLLTSTFTTLDALVVEHGLEKIKTIGDSYMAATGVADAEASTVDNAVGFALEAVTAVRTWSENNGVPLNLRVGIATGPVVCGVIGRKRPYFDLWGTTVNLASRLESTSPPGYVHMDSETANRIADRYTFENRGTITLAGLGQVSTCLLTGRVAESAAVLVDRQDVLLPNLNQPVSIGMSGSLPHSDIDPS